jgi:hypothetical protein
MILLRILIFCTSVACLIAGLTTVLSPDVNTIFIPFVVETVPQAHFVRSYAGFVVATGYLSMRFLYSSSRVQVGTVVLYIVSVMMISKIFSFIYEGFTPFSITSFVIGTVFAISLYVLQKNRKNQLDYNL